VKASHFQLGYNPADQSIKGKELNENVEREKWNPALPANPKHLGKSNFQLGNSSSFDGLSMNKNDFKDHGSSFDPNAKAKRLELLNQLRRSNLPQQHFEIPKSTA